MDTIKEMIHISPINGDTTGPWKCSECKALIEFSDFRAHVEWHRTLAHTAS